MVLRSDVSVGIESDFRGEPQADAAADYAAELLERMGLLVRSPGELRVRLNRGDAPGGGFHLQVDPRAATVTITAADAAGARCGLYAWLEELGVRWFVPGREPLLPALPLELAELRREVAPAFRYRGLHICAGSHHWDAEVGAWMSHLGMNRKLTHHDEVDLLGTELERLGLHPDTQVHSYAHFIPDARHFGEHPEWFSLVGGRRIRHAEGGQLCLANHQMRERFAAAAAEYLSSHPTISVVGIAPNDGYGWCECQDCRALATEGDLRDGTINGPIADFVHDICERMAVLCPGALVGHYAYSSFLDFINERPVFPPNLVVGCTLSRCYKHSIDDPDCPVNAPLHDRLRQLRAKVGHVTVYEYYMHNWGDLPAPQWEVVAADMRAFHRLGLEGFLTEVPGADAPGWRTFHLPIYVAARCLLDVETDLQALLRDYCHRRFGPAAEDMLGYFEALRTGVQSLDGCLRHRPRDLDRILSAPVRRQAERRLSLAERVARESRHQAEVAQERELFDRWCELVRERARYRLPEAVTALPLAELSLDAEPDDARRLALLDRISLLPPAANAAWVTLFADDERIGLLVECREQRMSEVVIHRENSVAATYGTDNVEVFLAADDAHTVYHFIINPEGYWCASECRGTRWNWSWASDCVVQTRIEADRWRVALTVPRAAIGARGDWRCTVARNRHLEGWQITGVPEGGAFFNLREYLRVRGPGDP